MNGMFNEMTYFNGVAETVPDMLKHIDNWGGPETFPHMAAGWAVAGNTPFTWTKQVASNFGGTRNRLVVHWPKRHQGQGRDPHPVPPRHRHRADGPRSGRPSRAEDGQRRGADADRRREHGLHLRRRRRRRTGTRRSTSRSSATAPSTTTAGWPRPSTRRRGKPRRGTRSPKTSGSSTTSTRTSARPTTSRRRTRPKLKELQALFLKEAEQVPRAADRRSLARALRPGHRPAVPT